MPKFKITMQQTVIEEKEVEIEAPSRDALTHDFLFDNKDMDRLEIGEEVFSEDLEGEYTFVSVPERHIKSIEQLDD